MSIRSQVNYFRYLMQAFFDRYLLPNAGKEAVMSTSKNRFVFGTGVARFAVWLSLLLLSTNTETAAQNFWQQTNGPYGGDIRALAINNVSGHIFVGTDGGGIFRSTNNGDSWTAVNTGLTETYVFALAINSSGHIFAGTFYGGGVFRSTNNGDSWTAVNTGLTNLDVEALAINASGHIFAGTRGGVFRSTDNGDSWIAVLTDHDNEALAINASGNIFAGTQRGGIFRSTNNGDNWTRVNTDLTNTIVLALAINSSGHIFAGTFGGGIFRSTNNGNSWTAINTGLTNTEVLALAINASGHIFAGTNGGGVFRSMNNDDSWTAVNTSLTNIKVYALAINASGNIFAGTNGDGIFRSMNNGDSWTAVNTGLTNTVVVALAINSSGHIFAGNFDGGVLGGGIFRSTNNGNSWIAVNTGLTNLDVEAIAINPSGHIFAGTSYGGGVFRSTDNGNSWTAVNTGLTSTSVYALAINASGNIFAGTCGGVFRSVESTTFPIVTTNAATNVGTISATLNGKVNPNNLSTTVKFQYGKTTSYGSEMPAMPNPVIDTSVVSVSAALTGLSPNTLYHFRVVGTNSLGTTNGVDQTFTTLLPSYPSTLSISTTVNYPSLPNAPAYKATDYRIVGLPGASNRSVRDFLAGEQNKDWQVYRDNGAANNFFVAFDGSSTFQFSVGRAFWIINKGPVNINTTVPSAPLNAAQEVVIPLQSGWNLITTPFTAAIAWSKIQAADTLSEPIYSFNGSFSESPTLDPYVGYYFFNTTNRFSLKIPYSLLFSTVAATNVDPAIWRVNISLSSSEFSDKSASFGIAPETNRDLDRLDFRKPRAIAVTPTVEFKRPAWDASYSTFATDIRPEFEASESWEFDVRATSRQSAQLAFTGIKRIPAHFEIYLIDASRAQSVNLREDSLYHFTPAVELIKFKVVVGRKENVQEQLSSLTLPKEFALGPNYPNPFLSEAKSRSAGNPSTTISVVVPLASEIELKVYDILGKEVKTLYHGALAAGRYWFSWDGRNAAGSNVVTGVYLYRLNTNTGVSLLGKMILIR